MSAPKAPKRSGVPAWPLAVLAAVALLAAVVAVQREQSVSSSVTLTLDEVEMEASRALGATRAIVVAQAANAELIASLTLVSQIHQSALLSEEPEAVAEVRTARERLTAASDALATALSQLDTVGEILPPSDPRNDPVERRLLGFVERGGVIVPRMVVLFGEANDRTLDLLEAHRLAAARANFLFEERARLEAVTSRVRRQVSALEDLASQVSAIAAEEVRGSLALVSDRAGGGAWTGYLIGAVTAVGAIGFAFWSMRRRSRDARGADLSPAG